MINDQGGLFRVQDRRQRNTLPGRDGRSSTRRTTTEPRQDKGTTPPEDMIGLRGCPGAKLRLGLLCNTVIALSLSPLRRRSRCFRMRQTSRLQSGYAVWQMRGRDATATKERKISLWRSPGSLVLLSRVSPYL